ncbi:hypothetical protein ACFW1A_04695 [Kitasatospora sp. NPDC058965]|uniref:hypothetical protein n=1 Tax=Kitasatospora sp. NPDC058965 TaxID=3346682 RepID=UPI0036B6611A
MTSEAAPAAEDLPVPAAVLAETHWGSLRHGMGSAEDAPEMLTGLLDTDERVRSRALDYLHHVVHQTRSP